MNLRNVVLQIESDYTAHDRVVYERIFYRKP